MCGCGQNMTYLGCFHSCVPISTGVEATVTGTWTVRVCFNGVWLERKIECVLGEEIEIENDYPENILLVMDLLKPDGKSFDTELFSFKNKICVTL